MQIINTTSGTQTALQPVEVVLSTVEETMRSKYYQVWVEITPSDRTASHIQEPRSEAELTLATRPCYASRSHIYYNRFTDILIYQLSFMKYICLLIPQKIP